ncbi:MAG: diguanylate cyclase [Candidatus Hydrogenedentes bacterium]|nr:diguanylate cyclase [Candidatus Hydrogenedentota bacterium]
MNSRILVLDDEKQVVDVIVTHLSAHGYECVGTLHPGKALELLRNETFSLLITDLRMPEISGMDVVREARDLNPDLAIVVLTALADVTNAIETMRAGADDYILKPFNLSEITVAVGRALDKQGLQIENRQYQEDLENRVNAATTDLEHVNGQLRETKEYLESLLHSTVDAIITTDRENRIEFANAGAEHMFGFSERALLGMSVDDLYVGGAEEVAYVRRKLGNGKPLQNYETELKHAGGFSVPVNMSVSMVHDAEGRVASILAICKDITEQKRLEEELKEMSIKDSLTGLYNQRHFYSRLQAEIERARRQGHPLSLLLFDIDQFKTYNDCHGHLAGDKVLQAAGSVVVECTRDHVDIGFRYGGDEFTVILPEADESQALSIAERIRASFQAKRFDHLTLSVGLMAYREGYSLRSLIQFTDAMMYDAKRSGGNRVFVYRPESGLEAEPARNAEEGEDA